jgi:hypothetical protein
MFRRLIPCIAVLAAATVVSAADYMFPSPKPPANLAPSNPLVKQYVAVIFDDNAYSGANGTQYEPPTYDPANGWATSGWVGGISALGVSGVANPLGITQAANQIGVSWAKNVLGAKTNPGGAKIHMTFNVITGVFVPTWDIPPSNSWQSRASKFGSYSDPAQPPTATAGFYNISRSWGREMAIGTAPGNASEQIDAITPMFKSLITAGNEIGNHTIDHMEPNSPLPNDTAGFGKWAGEGFDPGVDRDNEGLPVTPNEQTNYGLAANAWALTNGWEMFAGRKISTNAWAKYITLSEAQLKLYLQMQGVGVDVFGFRAPRLETNSCQFYALKQLGYQYDDGLEEGLDGTVDATNALWPYTLDNGTPNNYVQKDMGEKIYLDSMPAALWEIPLDAVVVPVALRPNIFSKYRQISLGAGDVWAANVDSVRIDSLEWLSNGKISALDFNMFILWGLDSTEFVTTMKANLDARLAHGKAPMQLACHTDYYTPIYDNATLRLPLNVNAYGLVVSKGWNTYKKRQGAVSAFLDYAIAQGASVVSGHELITAMKALQANDAPGTPFAVNGAWTFGNDAGTSTPSVPTATGDSINATVTFGAGSVDCGYLYPVTAGSLTGLTHVSLSYKTNTPLQIRLITATSTYFALLNNVGPQTASGTIPISAFVRDDTVGYTANVPVAAVNGIEITPLKVGTSTTPATFIVSKLKTYGVQLPLGVTMRSASNRISGIALARVSSSSVQFTAAAAGKYTVSLYGLDGRLVQSSTVMVSKAGYTNAKFSGKLSPSIYIVKIAGNGAQIVAKSMVSKSL